MKTGPRLLAFDVDRRRLIRQLLPRVVGLRRVAAAAPARSTRTAAPIRPMQFIGVIPPDIAGERAR
jgi:hypothetical protein